MRKCLHRIGLQVSLWGILVDNRYGMVPPLGRPCSDLCDLRAVKMLPTRCYHSDRALTQMCTLLDKSTRLN